MTQEMADKIEQICWKLIPVVWFFLCFIIAFGVDV
jgi:hypothetical protein